MRNVQFSAVQTKQRMDKRVSQANFNKCWITAPQPWILSVFTIWFRTCALNKTLQNWQVHGTFDFARSSARPLAFLIERSFSPLYRCAKSIPIWMQELQFARSIAHSPVSSLARSLACSLICSLARLFARSLIPTLFVSEKTNISLRWHPRLED